MEQILLNVQTRDLLRKQKVKIIRRNNLIPGIVYGGKKEPLPIKVDRKTFERIRRQHHGEIVFSLNALDGEKDAGQFYAMIREEQRHPVTGDLMHIDFIRISLTDKIEARIPIEAKGEPVGVKREGGALEHVLWELVVSCLPANIPEKFTLDVSNMEIGQSLYVKDIPLPEGVTTKNDPDTIVFTVVPPMKEEEAVKPEGPAEPEVIKEKKEKEEAAPEEAAAEPESKKEKKKKEE